jgi:membrane protease YdiL (CAAX protease family)
MSFKFDVEYQVFELNFQNFNLNTLIEIEFIMNYKQNHKAIIFTLLFFAIYLFFKQYFSTIKGYLDTYTNNGLLSYILTYIIIGTPIYIGTFLISPRENVLTNLGLNHNPIKPFLIALVFSLPMLIGGLLLFKLNPNISFPKLVAGTIVVGFIEELFFRGFLFGQLFKFTKLGFVSSLIIGAVLFASGHLYQSKDNFELVGIFIVTFMGAFLFAWLYVEWNFNLWIPVFLHSLMNLAWHLFEMDETALGGILPNVLRGFTIFIAIFFTIIYKRKNKIELAITVDKLIFKIPKT